MAQEEIVIRQYQPADRAFITNSWLKSYKDESNFAKGIPSPLYYEWHGEIVNRILDRDSATTLIAASQSDDDVIIGYSVTEKIHLKTVIHYVYVKRAFNGLGICKMLLDVAQKIEYSSHMTRSGMGLADKMKIKYCPYYLFV